MTLLEILFQLVQLISYRYQFCTAVGPPKSRIGGITARHFIRAIVVRLADAATSEAPLVFCAGGSSSLSFLCMLYFDWRILLNNLPVS